MLERWASVSRLIRGYSFKFSIFKTVADNFAMTVFVWERSAGPSPAAISLRNAPKITLRFAFSEPEASAPGQPTSEPHDFRIGLTGRLRSRLGKVRRSGKKWEVVLTAFLSIYRENTGAICLSCNFSPKSDSGIADFLSYNLCFCSRLCQGCCFSARRWL